MSTLIIAKSWTMFNIILEKLKCDSRCNSSAGSNAFTKDGEPYKKEKKRYFLKIEKKFGVSWGLNRQERLWL